MKKRRKCLNLFDDIMSIEKYKLFDKVVIGKGQKICSSLMNVFLAEVNVSL